MAYTAIDELDLIKANKIKLIEKINELLGVETNLTWTSTWTEIGEKIASLKTFLPEEDTEVHQEIDNFLQNIAIGNVKISSEKINEKTFYNKTSLEAIAGKFVKTIEASAFYGCTNLVSADFEKCTTIADSAFYNCQKLSSINLDFNNITTISTNAFYNCNLLPIVKTTFPNLSIIGNYGFYDCTKLVELDWNKLTSIGEYGLGYCTGITSLDLSSCQATVGQYAFTNCTGLADIVIGERIGTISNYAFSNSGTCDIYCELASKPTSWGTNWFGGHTAYWNAKLRDYTFVVNNGDENIVLNRRVIKNDDLPTITRDGYEFDSWYLDQNFETELSCPYISTDNLTIYARWIRGYNLVAVDYDTLAQHELGIKYYNNFNDLPQYIDAYTCVGYYSDSSLTNLVTELTETQLPGTAPTLYIKATPAAKRTEIYDFDYSGTVQEITLEPGTHRLECWGAQSIYSTANPTSSFIYGHGGYAAGSLATNEELTVYVYVGGKPGADTGVEKPTTNYVYGGWNGGGGKYSGSNYNDNAPGAGATDICLVKSPVTFTDNSYRRTAASYLSRLIVAGGAGGGRDANQHCAGGYCPSHGISYESKAGGMTSGAYFGYGAVGSNSTDDRAGGGGGWYGGGGNDDSYGGGGSSFVWSDEHSVYAPSDYSVPAEYKLTDISCISGLETQTSPNGEEEVGHTGNGFARITSTISNVDTAVYGTVELNIINRDTMQEAPVIIKQYLTNIYIPITLENWLDLDWYFDREMTKKVTYPLEIKLNDVVKLYSFGIEHAIYDFEYTGEAQEFMLPAGTYKLECWGAEGGHTNATYSTNYIEGHGGYASGILRITEPTDLFINVGGAGTISSSGTVALGGFNGGGNGRSSSRATTSGGGGSDIRIGTDSLYARVLVAGGGGGGRDAGNQAQTQVIGRSCGGDIVGLQGGYYNGATITTSTNRNGRGGGGGGYNQAGATGSIENSETLYPAQFGLGGYCANSSTFGEGGGGGWYGGGAGSADADGGGGSSYAYTADTAANYPSDCLLNSSYFLTETSTIAGNQQFSSPDGTTETGHTGNGHIRITKIRS